MASGQQLSPVDGLAQLSFVVQGMLEHRAAEHGLSIIQARLLGVLRDRKPTMNDLARLLGLDKSSVTGLVDRAERRGLVMRFPSITDRRVVLVSLTDDGRALVSQAAACFEADVLTMLEHRAAEHGLSIIQARLLGVLRDRKPTMNDLARLLGLDKSSVTGLVDRAERRGLVMRVPSITDRRVVLVSLTDDGRALVSQAAACFEADVLTMLDRQPSRDRDALSRLVSRLLAAHAAEEGIDLFPAAAELS
ncbi:MAG: MarR family winged helix-turn-helix transcriptional regulator [Trebonia sp.]